MYRECKDVIAQMSLFSSNESLEDVTTSEMIWVRGISFCIGIATTDGGGGGGGGGK
jgi:hypothetical protein